jgi:phenylacetate-CoA ligase
VKRICDVVSSRLFFPICYPMLGTPAYPRWGVRSMAAERLSQMKLSRASIRNLVAHRVRQTLMYAARHCEFYRERFKQAGLTRESDLVMENLIHIPALTKRDVQDHFAELASSGISRRNWRENSSGGSTGNPVVLLQDAHYRKEGNAITFASDIIQGWNYGNRVGYLWGAQRDTSAIRGAVGSMTNYLRNRRYYDSFDMAPAQMRRFHQDLTEFHPHNLIAYAGSAFLFASFLLNERIKPDYPSKTIITSAETLTEEMRSKIVECFGVPVFNRYGSREVGNIASECSSHQGLHLHLDKCLEVVDGESGRPLLEEPGKILVTLFSNLAMPLIRYDVGDIGILTEDECDCGLHAPMLRQVLGRSSDFIASPSGRMIHGEYFTHIFYGHRNVRQFLFVQETRSRFIVKIVSSRQMESGEKSHILDEIKLILGDSAEVRMELVDRIPPLISGKYRFTVSQVS